MSLDLYFDGASGDRAGHSVGGHEAHRSAWEARDTATGDAQEVGMLAPVPVVAAPDRKAPDVIAEVAARHQLRLDQIDEIAVDRGAIEPEQRQLLRNLTMAQRRDRSFEELENGDARSRSTEAGAPQHGGMFAWRRGRGDGRSAFGSASPHERTIARDRGLQQPGTGPARASAARAERTARAGPDKVQFRCFWTISCRTTAPGDRTGTPSERRVARLVFAGTNEMIYEAAPFGLCLVVIAIELLLASLSTNAETTS